MVIAARDHVKSWVVPKFDHRDASLVLYLPLWYQYSDMTGSTIYSYDRNRYSCTVTGATWGKQGRAFDGTDDVISAGSPVALDNAVFDNGGTILAWINPDSDGEANYGRIITKYGSNAGWASYVTGEATGKVKVGLHQDFVGVNNGSWDTTATEVTIGTFAFIAITYNNSSATNDPIIYVNGASKAITEAGTPSGTRSTDAAANLRIGDTDDNNTAFDGKIGEVWLFNRVLTAGGISRIYQATKWRYI